MTDTDSSDVLDHVHEQTSLLTGPEVVEPVATRVHRVSGLAQDLVGTDGGTAVALAGAAISWASQAARGFQRIPKEFAASRPTEDDRSALLRLVDDLDELSLLLVRAYDAAVRGDDDALQGYAAQAEERFPAATDLADVPSAAVELDVSQVDASLEVGEDGVPRIPVPERPEPLTDPYGQSLTDDEGQHP